MALRTARRLVVRGRPPGRAAGRTGPTQAQAASVRTVVESSVHRTSLWTDQRFFRQTSTFQTPSKDVAEIVKRWVRNSFVIG